MDVKFHFSIRKQRKIKSSFKLNLGANVLYIHQSAKKTAKTKAHNNHEN